MKVKFLLVDESSDMRKIVIQTIFTGNVFSGENAEMIEATNGAEGLEVFQSNKPHIILASWKLPTMNGLEMVKKVRESDKNIPIIMITSESEEDKKNEALAEGLVTGYAVKPLKSGDLEQKLLSAFQELKAQGAA